MDNFYFDSEVISSKCDYIIREIQGLTSGFINTKYRINQCIEDINETGGINTFDEYDCEIIGYLEDVKERFISFKYIGDTYDNEVDHLMYTGHQNVVNDLYNIKIDEYTIENNLGITEQYMEQ